VAGTYTVGLAAGERYGVDTLTIHNATATLDLAGTLTVATGLTVTAGTVQLDNGGTLAGSAALAAGAMLTGDGVVTGAVQNSGAIVADNGRLKIEGAVSGAGAITIDSLAQLEFGDAVSAGQTIAFTAGANEALKLDRAQRMAGEITGFAAHDVIDIKNLVVTSDSYSGGVLSLFDGTTQLASLAIAGNYTGQVFALSSDGLGGTNIRLAKDSTPSIAAPGPLTVAENTANPIAGISIADADAVSAGQTITVTLTDVRGALSATDAAGGTVTGAGTADLTITGGLGQVNADLATLTYTVGRTGTDRIIVSANDGDGGVAKSKTIPLTLVAQPAAQAATARTLALFTQSIAAFGADHGALAGRLDHLAAASHHLDLAPSR
jgi:hypothetical protein